MRKTPIAALTAVLAVALTTFALAAPLDAPSRKFEGRDLFGLQLARDPQIRPDGRSIAYVRVSYDVMTDRGRQSIWLVDAENGEQTPLVTGAGSHSSPRWSPTADRIAYVSTADGGRPQLFVRWMQSGQTARLAELVNAPDSLEWSPDGRWIAFTTNAGGGINVRRIPASGGTEQPLTAGLDRIRHIFYSPGGDWLYLQPNHRNIYRMPAAGGPRQVVTHFPESSGLVIEEPTISPDGRYLVYSRSHGGSSIWMLTLGDR